jgi:hypothetical protein
MTARGNSTNRYHQYVACAHLMMGEGCDDRDHIEDSDLGHRYYTRDEVPYSCQGVVALRERRAWRSCDRRLSSDRQGEFVERDRQPPVRRLLDRQLVVSLPNVLDEGMARRRCCIERSAYPAASTQLLERAGRRRHRAFRDLSGALLPEVASTSLGVVGAFAG